MTTNDLPDLGSIPVRSTNMKTCKQIKAERDLAYAAMTEKYENQMAEARVREFPLGSRVSFPHGAKRIVGVVIGYGEFDFVMDKVKIQTKSKAHWEKYTYELEPESLTQ